MKRYTFIAVLVIFVTLASDAFASGKRWELWLQDSAAVGGYVVLGVYDNPKDCYAAKKKAREERPTRSFTCMKQG